MPRVVPTPVASTEAVGTGLTSEADGIRTRNPRIDSPVR